MDPSAVSVRSLFAKPLRLAGMAVGPRMLKLGVPKLNVPFEIKKPRRTA